MPQAIEWSFATPKTSALRPSSNPMSLLSAEPLGSARRRPRLRYAPPIMPETPAADDTLRAALHGVRGLLLDLDGVLVLAGEAVPGAPEALAELDRRAFPYLVVTNTSLVSRRSLARWGRSIGFTTPPDRFQSALSASAELVRREYGDRAAFVIASDDALAEFAGLNVVDAAGRRRGPAAPSRRSCSATRPTS